MILPQELIITKKSETCIISFYSFP